MRIAFFQRIFAHYQAGLVVDMALSARHDYVFFGSESDPEGSGIAPLPAEARAVVDFRPCTTTYVGRRLAFQWRAVREASIGRFDALILEGNVAVLTNWIAIAIARVRRRRVLLYTHGWLQQEHGARKFVRNAFYGMADGLILYGMRARRIGERAGFDPADLFVAYTSLPHARGAVSRNNGEALELRRETFGDSNVPLIVSVGRLTSAKRYDLLVEAAARLKAEGLSINLALIGDGPRRGELEAQARTLGVRLVCTGAIYDETSLERWFAAADVTVIPGAAGLTVVHSLSHGVPVIVHDNDDEQMPESEALEDGKNGATFRAGDAQDLARAIRRVLETLPRSARVAAFCREVIDAKYNPAAMREVFDRAVEA